MDSFWDPNTWPVDDGVRRIYLDDFCNHFAVVDVIDFEWLTQWRWSAKPSKNGKKLYAYRTAGPRASKYSLYMHVAIMQRIEPRPDWSVVQCDHKNGNSLYNRRENLRWATPGMNRRNINGSYTEELHANS